MVIWIGQIACQSAMQRAEPSWRTRNRQSSQVSPLCHFGSEWGGGEISKMFTCLFLAGLPSAFPPPHILLCSPSNEWLLLVEESLWAAVC